MAEPIRSALLVHGVGGGGWEWNVWRGVLRAAGIAASAPDLRPAVAGLAATSLEDYIRQVREAVAALPRPRALVGASLGGLLAMACADDADALVLVNPMPPSPLHAGLPARDWPDLVPWRREASLAGTRRAMPDADDATALFAFRRWRDESGPVLRAAQAGVAIERPACPVLCIASRVDEDVPPGLTAALASAWSTDLIGVSATSHVGPLLGRDAGAAALLAAQWLQRAVPASPHETGP